jgi:hypothetical protein
MWLRKKLSTVWNVKILQQKHFICSVTIKVIPVIIGTSGTISKSFIKYLSNIPGKHKTKKLQITAILGTAHTLR